MADKDARLRIADVRGGRNGTDPALALADWHVADAVNVDFFGSTGPRRRNGTAALSMTGSTMTGVVSSLFRHVPTTDETLAEMWAVDDAATPIINRLAGGATWAAPTLKDAPAGNGWDFTAASLNGKLFLAFKSAQPRLHCYDPNASGGAQVRRVGLPAMGVPSATNTGSGSYGAVGRYYRTRATVQSSGITLYRSEPSPNVNFTPSGSGTAAVVTQGSVPSEGETHWEVEASTDGVTFFLLSTVVIGTTTYSDSALTSAYSSGAVSVITGTYTLPKSYKFIAADQSRMLGFGSWTTTDKQDSVEFTAIVGSSNISDDERIPTGNYVTLDENDSGVATGLVGPVNGSYFAFKYRSFYKLTPTGVSAAPYSPLKISPVIGAVSARSIYVGEDESGNPAIYWMSHRGPYRYGLNGLEYLGHNNEDRILGSNGGVTINLAATKVVAHSIWHGDKRQMWMGFANGSSNDPNETLMLSVGHSQSAIEQSVPDGWSRFTGGIAAGRCSVMFSNTVGASMSHDLKPYIGLSTANNTIVKCDTGTQDAGSNYQGYIVTKAYTPAGLGTLHTVEAVGIAVTTSAISLSCSVINGSGLETNTDTADLTASAAGESRKLVRFGGNARTSSAPWFQLQIGDGSAQNAAWQIDQGIVKWTPESQVI